MKMNKKIHLNLLVAASIIMSHNFAECKELDIQNAIKDAKEQNLKTPKPDPDGRVQTLNKKGAMSPALDQMSQAFVEFAAQPGKKVLEIGVGYGLACTKALTLGAQDYTANDLDERHLKILALSLENLNPQLLAHVHLLAAEFPQHFQQDKDKYDGMLIARVFHFMNPYELKRALDTAFKMLKPGGKLFAVMMSPYVKGFETFIPEFEKRVTQGHPNPGYLENLLDYADYDLIPKASMDNTPQKFFFFDTRTARKALEDSGFIIEKVTEMPLAYPSQIWQLDGRENIGLIAVKPLIPLDQKSD